MNTKTYKESEDILILKGFKFEVGMPLTGMRFKSKTQYAVLFRNSDASYKTYFYDIVAKD